MEPPSLLEIQDLEVQYRAAGAAIKAVDGVDMEIRGRECVAIIGESGSGKSTIANAILRVLPENARITRGRISFRGESLLDLAEEEMRKVRGKDLSMVFQDPHSFLNPVLKIGDQLEETIRTHRAEIARGRAAARAVELLSMVKIPDPERILNRYPYQLSGGMAQRVALALGLSSEPALLIADEPTSALDLTIQAQVVKLLKGLMDLLRLSVLLITHDLSLVSNIAERVYVMYAGRVVEEDRISGLYRNPGHPYTLMLLDAVKKLQGEETALRAVGESGGGAGDSLCPFLPRCPGPKAVCREKSPPYREFPDGKKVLCWV
jgi:oligopeptide/dipeptide ABC transporter ATP-binding protein